MGDENPIRTLGDYSKPSQRGYRNTIELPAGKNVDFLKLVDSLDLDYENRERTRLRLFQFSLRDQASNWLERLPAGSITTWEDLTTRFLAQLFPPGRTAKLRNDILMFQQHHGESLSEAWTRPTPQPQALGTNFEARVRDYMAAHNERMERFENTIFKQCEEINDRMTKMFRLLKEIMTSRTPEKVLIKEEAKFFITKSVNSISLARNEEEENNKADETPDNTKMPTETEMPNDEAAEASGSQPVVYYLKHKINENIIKGLVKNNRFNNSLSGTRVGKKKTKAYKVLHGRPVYDAILKKKITKKEDIRGNFEIPCSIGDLKQVNSLELIKDRSSYSYIYPLGIVEDVLVEVDEHVFPVDFVILDIKENEKRPFILGTPFLTTAKATIKFDTGTITLRSGKSKVSFHRISDSSCMTDKGVKNDIEPIAPIMTVNRLVLEWEERIRLHLEKEMKFNQWRGNNFKN
ncbi:MAK10-like protein [Tanacetum coccineum]